MNSLSVKIIFSTFKTSEILPRRYGVEDIGHKPFRPIGGRVAGEDQPPDSDSRTIHRRFLIAVGDLAVNNVKN